jgi:3-methyl-2-oxobutanoate hydroxymethyltransferase
MIMSGYLQENQASQRRKPITTTSLQNMRNNGEKIAMLTCYDASFATLMENSGIETILIGDSLGMVCQGQNSTIPVTIDDVAYHTKAVARGCTTTHLVADLPFGTYATPLMAYENATILMRAGAHMVKFEGGAWLAETVQFLTQRGIPVCVHLGLTPQSVHAMGGFKVQGKTNEAAQQLIADAIALQNAGATLMVLEGIPAALGKEVTERLTIPTIGIGAGPDCSGQVLVLHDAIGVFPGHKAKFVRDFMQGSTSIGEAFTRYVAAVKDGSFPAIEHCF